jgi:DNA topoisomerase IB
VHSNHPNHHVLPCPGLPLQMATALYFIDKLALRAGHEKDEDEADTVGCCTLKVLAGAC